MLPVGGSAASLNYSITKSLPPLLGALSALSLVFLANAPLAELPLLSSLPPSLLHSLHCGGLLHRATNLLGCAVLIFSNRVAHRRVHAMGADCCKEDGARERARGRVLGSGAEDRV